ncbi:MAG: RNA-binding transcriptional accessory protein [Clostridiales bacterium]|nr:RNA-binding transcriptional accessory protein [Clostridiales bacterium]
MDIAKQLSMEMGLTLNHTNNIISLLDEGCTIPFIARYRKELTGSCDDQTIRLFDDRLKYLRNLNKRKEEVANLITEQGNMTEEIQASLDGAVTITEVEDIYRPFKPKRKTRASVAIAKGLQPLADKIVEQKPFDLEKEAENYISEEKGVATTSEAIQGAKDIIAEMISDNASLRKELREAIVNKGFIKCKLDEEKEGAFTYEMYKEYNSDIKKLPSHRILAINRGEKEDYLKVSLTLNEEIAHELVEKTILKKNSPFEEMLKEVCLDSYDRLIFPSIEREVRNELTDKANEQAIKMFEVNLKPLLMQPPLKNKIILGLDPAYRTGCKIAVIDSNGKVLDTAVVYPTPPQNKIEEATAKLTQLIMRHDVDVISIGNGTATKESEIFVANLIKDLPRKVNYAVVNEAGASVYSASKLGAAEFPDFDVALRSAVSIARRLQDPLAELIKIDVKSIGVGQYQHDMPQNRLTEVLNGVVENCVNTVGVDVNTASPSLLSFVAGLNSGVAKNIEKYRQENGAFKSKETLKKVPKLGEKAFEQCAGFLRIVDGDNILDNTGVHPESYDAVYKLLDYFKLDIKDAKDEKLTLLPKMVEKEGVEKLSEKLGIGAPTLVDIANELAKPGRDIRDDLPKPVLKSALLGIENLKVGMVMTGVVRNVIDFGVFVDISVHQDGLVHISEISKDYIKHPSEALKVGDVVKVKVIGLDIEKKRISLTIKGAVDDELTEGL